MPLHMRVGGILVPSRLSGVARVGGSPIAFSGEEPPLVLADDVFGPATDFGASTWDDGDWPWSFGDYDVDTTAGTLTLPAVGAYAGIDAGLDADFTGKRVIVKTASFPDKGTGNGGDGSIEAALMVYDGGDTGSKKLTIVQTQGQLVVSIDDSWQEAVPFSASAMRWWQIREDSGTVYFEYSANGKTWTTLHSVSSPAWLASHANVQLMCGHWDEPSDPDTAWVVDAVNYRPADRATSGLVTAGPSGNYASTPDHASLGITGDIDIRVDLTCAWQSSTTDSRALVAMFDDPSDRGFLLRMSSTGNHALQFVWSPTGTTTGQLIVISSAVPFESNQRGAVRVSLDVDDGSGNRVVRFYTAPTIDGPWTQLGSTITQSGTTAIADVNVPLAVGAWSDGGVAIDATFHALQIRDSNGTLVVDARFDRAWLGTNTYTDKTGKVWTLHGTAHFV